MPQLPRPAAFALVSLGLVLGACSDPEPKPAGAPPAATAATADAAEVEAPAPPGSPAPAAPAASEVPPPASAAAAPAPPAASPATATAAKATYAEGEDYLVLERARFLDTAGFDRPVEAFSVLLPRGWNNEGGVRWRGFQECRGDMITSAFSSVAPDSSIRLDAFPTETYVWFDDAMLRQSSQAAVAQGGCQVNAPFTAKEYLEHFAANTLGGAKVSGVESNRELAQLLRNLGEESDRMSAQYGMSTQSQSSAITARLTWPNGDQGRALIAVTTSATSSRDMFTGLPNGFSSTQVLQRVVLRHSSKKREQAEQVLATAVSSYRTNPAWQQGKDQFLAQLSNIEHKGNMERIRIAGEQSRAFARSASEASDARMRSWEQSQSSSDAQQKRFVQAIREVETWTDPSGGGVELSAGFDQAWSRGDGSYILSNRADFDPAAVFLDQEWKQMKRAD